MSLTFTVTNKLFSAIIWAHTSLIFFGALVFSPSPIHAQNVSSDFELIQAQHPSNHNKHSHQVTFGIANHRNVFIKYNPVTLTLSSLMFTYQKWVSPQISSNCYFEPTCSRYSVVLYQELGVIKGTLATADRLMRCDRISATTFSPISIDPKDGKIHETPNRYRLHEK